jgi:hypothetical protein
MLMNVLHNLTIKFVPLYCCTTINFVPLTLQGFYTQQAEELLEEVGKAATMDTTAHL